MLLIDMFANYTLQQYNLPIAVIERCFRDPAEKTSRASQSTKSSIKVFKYVTSKLYVNRVLPCLC